MDHTPPLHTFYNDAKTIDLSVITTLKINQTFTLLFIIVNCDFSQCIHTGALPSGTHTAACSDTAFLPPATQLN